MAKNWFRNLTRRRPAKARKPLQREGVALMAEQLEERSTPAIFTVTWDGQNPAAQPGGTMSLAQAIAAANALPGTDQINFSNTVTNVLVNKTMLLPTITDTLVVEGLTGVAKVNIHFNSADSTDVVNGFTVNAPNCIIRNLNMMDDGGPNNYNGPGEYGIKVISAAGGFNLQNVQIGTTTGNGFDGDAVQIVNSANNIIGGAGNNQAVLIFGNNGDGVSITGAGSTGNLVQQTTISQNAGDGVRLDGGSSGSIIGGFTLSPVNSGNRIFLNTGNGVHLDASSGNRIQRNFLGNDGSATAGKGNGGNGILVENGSANNIIGGNDLTAGNKISGNTENGIYIRGKTSSANQIQSNLIGFDPTATNTAMPNSGNGILVEGAAGTLVGSTTTAANYISGNNLNGVMVTGVDSAGTIIVNNRIGIGGTSLAVLDTKVGNVQDGILLSGVINVTVGGAGTNAQNIIGANRNGVAIVNSSTNITVKGNWLGLNRLPNLTYGAPIGFGNLQDGVFIQNSSGIQIGGTQSLEGNKIASNRNGVHAIGSNTITMQGNFIGPNLTGSAINPPFFEEIFEPPFQAEDGVLVESSSNVKIGTPAQGGGNLISHNRHGISITKGSSDVFIQNNLIGTQRFATRTPDLGNQDDGIFIDASTKVTIGGTGASNANTIAKNLDGIQVSGGSSFVTIQGNLIRNNSQSGVRIENSSDVTVGGAVAAAKNTINNRFDAFDTTFTVDGVFIVSGSHDNVVQGNWLGTDSLGSDAAFLLGNGVLIDGSSNNVVGMTTVSGTLAGDLAAAKNEGNIIAFNQFNGIAVVESTGPATGNKLSGNSIFENGRLGIDLGNTAGNVNLNDVLDLDTGANNSQNFPVLTLAQSLTGTGTRVQGILNSAANRTYRIEFFHIDAPNPTGNPINYGQGKTYIGSLNVTTDGAGNASYTFTNPNILLPAGQFITATATDVLSGDTSEFSLAQVIEGAPGPLTYVVNSDGNYFLGVIGTGPGSKAVPAANPIILIPPNGNMTLDLAIKLANEHPGDDRIVFALNPEFTITPSGAITYYQESRWVVTNGDLPDITDTVIIDGSPLAWPQTKGGATAFNLNYSVMFNNASHGFAVTDNPTAQAQFSNPNATADLVVFRHINVVGVNINGIGTPPGIGVELASKFGGANLQDMTINGFGGDGVRITNSPNNIVGGSGADQAVNIHTVSGSGVNIFGAPSTGNLVQQTNIGTQINPNGTGGAGGNGIWIQSANNNTIGGFVGGTGVTIQASGASGIFVVNSSGTRIQRSTIGDPTNLFPNHFDGVRIENSPLTLIGGVTADAGNNISGNTENGINIYGVNSAGAKIQSNTVGTTTAPNSGDGILVDNVANVEIGSTVTAANNVNGNNLNGIEIRGVGSVGARIVNTSVNSNLLDGILIDGVPDVIIGSSLSNAGGTVSKNRRGISILPGSSQIIIQQYNSNFNSEEGIRIDSSSNILIGGTGSSIIGNQASGNRDGIRVLNSNSVALQGNFIGTDRGGNTIAGFGQSEDGVIIDGSSNVSVGAPIQFGDNVISGNRNGVRVINGSSNFTIQNNEIGSNRAGTTLLGNTDDGIRLDAILGATVGGTQTLSPNFVSGNRNGLHLVSGTTLTTVLGNAFVNSTESGVLLEGSSNNQIGGQTVASRNVISANDLNGIYFKPDFSNPFNPIFSNNNKVQGNFIGTGLNGTGIFGNGNAGIYIDGGSNNLIGGIVHDTKLKLEEGNIIANSGLNGVAVVTDSGAATGNAIRGNAIFGSGLLGIDLNGNLGLVDDNDPLDLDGGANESQNYPEVISAQAGTVGTMIQAKLSSAPSTTYHIEFFGTDVSNPTGTPNGFGQGKVFLGSTDVTTDAAGDAANINFATLTPLASGWWVSATATDPNGNTSEFGKAVQSEDATGLISGIKFNDLNGNGLQDTGEPGLPGWEIDLDYGNDGTIELKAFTDAAGKYSFPRLIDGVYKITEVQKLGWIQTHVPIPNPVQITAGSAVTDVDFGNFKLIKISGNKFEDLNGNGVRDAGEGPLSGVVIDLFGFDAKTGNKLLLGETTTDLSGNYAFTNVGPGGPGGKGTPANGIYTKWEVHEKVPSGYVQTAPASGFYTISVISGTDVGGLDFGNKKGSGGPGGGATGPQIIAGSGAGSRPLAIAYSAKGLQMFSIVPYATTFTGGVRVAKGDVNGDNVNDIIVAPGAGMAPLVKVYNGTDGKLMQQFNAFDAAWKNGVFVGAADVNGDGASDIIVGADKNGSPEVRVYDGQTGIQLFQFLAYSPFFRGGVRVAGGDVNGDGFADIIVAPGAGMAPTVKVFDGSVFGTGKTPATLLQFNAYEPSFTRGVFVASGNFNGDAFADIVTGPDTGRLPSVRVWDGTNGALIKDLLANSSGNPPPPSQVSSDPTNTSGMRVAVADIDGDGISDIITGPGVLKNPRVRVYSGATWAKVLDFAALPLNFLGGVYVG